MEFKKWLLSEAGQNIQFGGWWSDGRVIVYIDRQRYVYVTDAIYHGQLKKMAKYKPWSALNLIKTMIKNGDASQLEPALPAPEAEKPQEIPPKMTQRSFWA